MSIVNIVVEFTLSGDCEISLANEVESALCHSEQYNDQLFAGVNTWEVTELGEDETIVSTEYLQQLEDTQNFMYCLQNAGVDNWDGYEMAIDAMEEQEG